MASIKKTKLNIALVLATLGLTAADRKKETEKFADILDGVSTDDYGGWEEAVTCCGVTELTRIPASRQGIAGLLLNADVSLDTGTYLMYYSVGAARTKHLRYFGFTVLDTFTNPNSGNKVTILGAKL